MNGWHLSESWEALAEHVKNTREKRHTREITLAHYGTTHEELDYELVLIVWWTGQAAIKLVSINKQRLRRDTVAEMPVKEFKLMASLLLNSGTTAFLSELEISGLLLEEAEER